MEKPKACKGCGGELPLEASHGFCPVCLLDSFLSSSGPFSDANPQIDPEAFREHWRPGGGRFHLIRELGKGGMGQVYLAEDSQLGNLKVALKFLHPKVRGNERYKSRLCEELIRSRELQHPNIVKVYDWHDHGNGEPPFLSMEYIDGVSLSSILHGAGGGGLPYDRLYPLFIQICEALIHAHTVKGLVHRDLKPANILVARQGPKEIAKLVDFGLTRPVDPSAATMMGGDFHGGTRAYMSPAHWEGKDPSLGDDIFALGVTMYELLTGSLPFGPNGCLSGPLRPISDFVNKGMTGVPQKVRAEVMNCLQLDEADRTRQVLWVLGTLRQNPPTGVPIAPVNAGMHTGSHADDAPAAHSARQGLSYAFLGLIVLLACGIWQRNAIEDWAKKNFSAKVVPVVASPSAVLNVSVIPEDLSLEINGPGFKGEFSGLEGPLVTNLVPNRYTVVAHREGYLPLTTSIELSPDKTNHLDVALHKPGRLVLQVQPESAQVTIHGKSLQQPFRGLAANGEIIFSNLPPGQFEVAISNDGFATNILQKTVQPGGHERISVSLERLYSKLETVVFSKGPFVSRPFVTEIRNETGSLLLTNFSQGAGKRVQTTLPTGRWFVKTIWPGDSYQTNVVEMRPGLTNVQAFGFGWAKLDLKLEPPVNALLRWVSNGTEVVTPIFNGQVSKLNMLEGVREFWIDAEQYNKVVTNLYVTGGFNNKASATHVIRLARSSYPLPGDDFLNSYQMKMVWHSTADCWIGRTEVTQEHFKNFVTATGRNMQGMRCLTEHGEVEQPDRSFQDPGFPTGPNHPVIGVSWEDAVAYCAWLTESERNAGRLAANQAYSLPTLDQWQSAYQERLRRSSGALSSGNHAGPEVLRGAWPAAWRGLVESKSDDGHQRTAPVGVTDRQEADFDVQNLADNVQEWCLDAYDSRGNAPELLKAYPATLAQWSGKQKERWKVVCGGSWYDHDPLLWGLGSYHCGPAAERTDFRGFRVVIIRTKS